MKDTLYRILMICEAVSLSWAVIGFIIQVSFDDQLGLKIFMYSMLAMFIFIVISVLGAAA